MCYLLIIAAPEAAAAEIRRISVGELSTWRETNASILAALPDNYTLYCVGVAHHCSCGCVRRSQRQQSTDSQQLVLEPDAAKMLEMAVAVAGQLAFIVHWSSGELASEEIQITFGPGLSRFMLLQPQTVFETDQLIWVAA